jgi:hypothetical protein
MATGSFLTASPVGEAKLLPEQNRSPLSYDVLTDIIRRSTGNKITEAPSGLDVKRLVERAMAIDTARSASPLSEGQWDFGLDMLARAEEPAETGLALRQERIIGALSSALAELRGDDDQIAS